MLFVVYFAIILFIALGVTFFPHGQLWGEVLLVLIVLIVLNSWCEEPMIFINKAPPLQGHIALQSVNVTRLTCIAFGS